MSSSYSIEAVFKAIDRISAPVREMERNVIRSVRGMQSVSAMLGGSLSRAIEPARAHVEAIDRGFMAVGGAALVAGTAVAAIGSNIIETGATFDRTLMSAVARFPGEIQRGSDAFEELRKAAERVGATTEFDAQQAAGALNVFAAAGFNAEQAVASLAGAGDLATVSGLSLDVAASTAADSLGALGLRADNAAELAANLTRVNDLFARTTSLANTSATDMAEAVKAGGNAAVRSGASIETFGALVASMAGSNIKGAEAGTAIRNMFLRLQAPAARGSAALRQLGISVRDGDGNMRDMVTVMGELATATANMGTAEKNAALSHIFGAETIGPALAVLGTGAEGLERFRTALEQSNGAAARMAGTMRDTAAGDIDGFTSAIDGVKTAIFGLISGPLRQVLQSMTEWIAANTAWMSQGIGSFVQSLADNFDTLLQRMRGLAVVVSVLAAISLGFKAMSAAATIFNAIAAMNPYVAIFYAVLAVIGLIVAYWPEISAFFRRIWNAAKEMASRVMEWLTAAWDSVKGPLMEAASAIGSALSSAWEGVKSFLTAAFEFYVGWMTLLWRAVEPLVRPVIDFFISAVQWIMDNWEPIKGFFAFLWDGIKTAATTAWTIIRTVVSGVANGIQTAFTAAWDFVVTAATSVVERIKAIFAPIAEFFSGLWSSIASLFESIVGAIIDRVGGVIAAVRGVGAEVLGTDGPGGGPQVVSPQERTARAVTESNSTTRSEVTIRDQTGRAEITRQPRNGPALRLQPSGGV